MAQWSIRSRFKPGDTFVHESIIGSIFNGRIEAETELAGIPANVPSIEGWDQIHGCNHIILDEDDPCIHGF